MLDFRIVRGVAGSVRELSLAVRDFPSQGSAPVDETLSDLYEGVVAAAVGNPRGDGPEAIEKETALSKRDAEKVLKILREDGYTAVFVPGKTGGLIRVSMNFLLGECNE